MLILQLAEEKEGKGRYLFLIRMRLENYTHHFCSSPIGQNLVLCTHREAKGKGAVSLKHRTVIWVQNEDPSDLEKVTFVHYVISW